MFWSSLITLNYVKFHFSRWICKPFFLNFLKHFINRETHVSKIRAFVLLWFKNPLKSQVCRQVREHANVWNQKSGGNQRKQVVSLSWSAHGTCFVFERRGAGFYRRMNSELTGRTWRLRVFRNLRLIGILTKYVTGDSRNPN